MRPIVPEWITTDDIRAETWRRLLEFANQDLSIAAILDHHQIDSITARSQRSNIRKQASQIRTCILQAREYFAAFDNSTLFTRPNHLYYGVVSLASAIMLLLGDGACSLDKLRQSASNNQHGLALLADSCAAKSAHAAGLLANVSVQIAGRGHLQNWYTQLPADEYVWAIATEPSGDFAKTNLLVTGRDAVARPHSLTGRKLRLIDLLHMLPDAASDLRRLGYDSPTSRVSFTKLVRDTSPRITLRWDFHGARAPHNFEELLAQFSVKSGYLDNLECHTSLDGTAGTVIFRYSGAEHVVSFPTIRMTLLGEQIAYGRFVDTPEFLDSYMFAFGLSMLCRYYPDIWHRCIVDQTSDAALIDQSLRVLALKLPVLALSYLCRRRVIISTLRCPWW